MPKASTSRNHRIMMLTEEQQKDYARLGWQCTRNCPAPAAARVAFEFVTGRAGRIGSREALVCTSHAMAFAARHALDFPAAPARPDAAPEKAGQ